MAVFGILWAVPLALLADTHYVNVSNAVPQFPYTNWTDAATSIQAAVDTAVDGDTVLVTNGTYTVTNALLVATSITVRSVNGYMVTVIDGADMTRCCSVTCSNAVLEGFTITRGYSANGGGVGISGSGGTLRNCRITRNNALDKGGGVYLTSAGRLENCLIDNNGAAVVGYQIVGKGGGVETENGGAFVNCTVVANSAAKGWGGGVAVEGGTALVRNTIVFGNSGNTWYRDWHGESRITRESSPDFSGDPDIIFVDFAREDYRPCAGSPCIDAGTNQLWMAGGRDIVGFSRIVDGRVDIGAFEYGGLFCDYDVSIQGVLSVIFTARTSGATQVVNHAWDFNGDGTSEREGPGATTVTNTYLREGIYTTTLTVRSATGQSAVASKTINLTGMTWFTATPTAGLVPLEVVFSSPTYMAAAPDCWYQWDFDGDGSVDADGVELSVVTNLFTASGYYSPRLSVTNALGQFIEQTRADYVHVEPITFDYPPEQKIKAVGGDYSFEMFGWALSMCGDLAIVGSPKGMVPVDFGGAARVFRRSSTEWVPNGTLVPADVSVDDWFGYAVAISRDHAFVSSIGDDDCGQMSGSVYVFRRQESGWVQEAKLTASDGSARDRFGQALDLSGDCILVGAHDADGGANSGAAYVFRRTGGTGEWAEEYKLTASGGSPGDRFGASVSLDGDWAAIGAFCDDQEGVAAGAVHVFEHVGDTWLHRTKLMAPDASTGDEFGKAVALCGPDLAVGAPRDADNGVDSGSVYVFARQDAGWICEAKLEATDGNAGDVFGCSVAICDTRILVGASGDRDNHLSGSSAYVFSRNGGKWSQERKLWASDGAYGGDSDLGTHPGYFGSCVGLSDGWAIIGAWFSNGGNGNSGYYYGSAYLYYIE